MALISMADWIDRYGDADSSLGEQDVAPATFAPTIVVPLRRRRTVEPLHGRLRSHARLSAMRRALQRRLAESARFL